MTPAPAPPAPPGDLATGDPFEADDPDRGPRSLLGQWANAIGPMFFGLQVGSVVGHLAQRALGQYPLAVPGPPLTSWCW